MADPPPLARRAISLAALAALLFLAYACVHFTTRPLGAGDIFWQVRTGELILRTGRIPAADPFSYTVHGAPWNNHEWGFELLAALLYRAAGWGGFRALVLVLWGSCAAGVARAVARRAGLAAGLLAAVVFLLLSSYKLVPAPQTLSMGLFLLAWRVFRGPGLLAPGGRYGALLALLVLWGNLTAEVLLFLPFLLWDQSTHLLRAPRRRLPVVLLLLATVAPLANPPASSVLEYALTGTAVNREVNGEFARLWEPAATVPPASKHLARVLVAVYLVAVAWSLRRRGLTTPQARRFGAGLLAVTAATLHERNLWLLILPSSQLLLARVDAETRRAPDALMDLAAIALAGLLFAGFARALAWSPGLAWRSLGDPAWRARHLDRALLPVDCAPALAALPAGTRVFTSRLWASYVLWRAPQARVFIDGRNREYPPVLHRAAREVWSGGPRALRILDAVGTERVLAPPPWSSLPGVQGGPWRVTYQRGACALFARDSR